MPQPYLRASQQWGTSVRDVGYGWIWSPPSTEIAEVEVVELVEAEVAEVEVEPVPETTVVDAAGGLSLLGRWLIRFWLRVTVRRTR
jgi:hypothetical protein